MLAQAGAAQFYINSPALLVLPFEFQIQTELKSPPWLMPLHFPELLPVWKTKQDSKPVHHRRLHRSRAQLSKLGAILVLQTSGVVL